MNICRGLGGTKAKRFTGVNRIEYRFYGGGPRLHFCRLHSPESSIVPRYSFLQDPSQHIRHCI